MSINIENKYVGLIPAAGRASRLPNLSCSKEIYPVPASAKKNVQKLTPVSSYLIQSYKLASVNNVKMILREGKEDILEALGNGQRYGVQLSYLYTKIFYGPPYSLDAAYSDVKNKIVAIGFPDILFTPRDAFVSLFNKQEQTQADVVLGLFVAPHPHKMDMVEFDSAGNIKCIQIKPSESSLKWTWILAVWSPVFTEFMHQSLKKLLPEFESKQRQECHVGTIFQLALEEGIRFDYVHFDDGELIDIGTPDDLHRVEHSCPDWLK